MAVSKKISRAGLCSLFGVLGFGGAQTAGCSAPFHSCYETRTCRAEHPSDAGAAGDESGSVSGGPSSSSGASGSGEGGTGGESAAPGSEEAGEAGRSGEAGEGGRATEAGGSGEAGEGGTSGVPSGGSSAGGTANGGMPAGGAGAGGVVSSGGGGSAGAPPACNPCAKGFACSTTTCKTTCSADADCLSDHFCSSGECRLDAVQVSIGSSHACMLLADKTVNCWGKNELGQLGNASPSASAAPVPVKFLTDVQSIAVGGGITFALLNDGRVVFWGMRPTAYNTATGATGVAYQYPTPVEGLSGVKQIAAGARGNGCALLADGSVRCWGLNDWGQLGNGTSDFSIGPVVVSGVNGATAIDFGYAFVCAQTPSAVQCWGDNIHGNLGNHPDSLSNTPQTISGLSGTVSKLRTGDSFGCALMTNGTIQCWGDNSSGQLGNGTSGTGEKIPVTVSTIPNVTDITAATTHACALLSGGTVRCWGGNYDGQVGNGNNNSPITSPTAVQGISGAIAIAAGGYTSCAIASNGSVKCWGRVVEEDSTDYLGATTIW